MEIDLAQALSSINPDLDSWEDNTQWSGGEKIATTLDEQDKDALGTDVDWSEEQ